MKTFLRNPTLIPAVLSALVLAGCAASPNKFYQNPSSVGTSSLCRAYLSTRDPKFQSDTLVEINRRGLGSQQCVDMVNNQDAAIAAGLVLGLAGAAAATCANSGGCANSYSAPSLGADWDLQHNQYGQLVWACRDVASGQYTYTEYCQGKLQADTKWPGV